MKRIKFTSVLLLLVAGVMVLSCKKNKKDDVKVDGSGYTDLLVYVVDSSQSLLSGAQVKIYNSQSAMQNDVGAISIATTGPKGFVYFSNMVPATYYARASKKIDGSDVVGFADTGIQIKAEKQSAVTIILE